MLCNKHLCLALKPYLDRELRNGRGVIKVRVLVWLFFHISKLFFFCFRKTLIALAGLLLITLAI